MKTKPAKRQLAEAAVGAVVGGFVAGPIGAVAGGLAAGHVESGLEKIARLKPPEDWRRIGPDDPLLHVHPKRILVPLDFSPPSQRALRFAREWATGFGSELILLHVVEPENLAGNFRAVPPGTIQRDDLAWAKAGLKELAQKEFPTTIPVRTVVRKGLAFDQIASVAHQLRADLIIIATHGRTGLKHVLLGSTAERVARHAQCPVLILRRRKKRFVL